MLNLAQVNDSALRWYTFLVDGGEVNYIQSARAKTEGLAREEVNRVISKFGDVIICLYK